MIAIAHKLLGMKWFDIPFAAVYVFAWMWAIAALEFWREHRGEEILVRGPWWKFWCFREAAWRGAENNARYRKYRADFETFRFTNGRAPRPRVPRFVRED